MCPAAADSEDLGAELAPNRRQHQVLFVCDRRDQVTLTVSGNGRSPDGSEPTTTSDPAPSVWVIVTFTKAATKKRSWSGGETVTITAFPVTSSCPPRELVSRRESNTKSE